MPANRVSSAFAPLSRLKLPPRSLATAGIAFGVGLLLFVVVWLASRKSDVVGPAPVVAEQAGTPKPLPAPLPAGAGASEMPDARPVEQGERPQLVETVPTPAEPTPTELAAANAATTQAPARATDRPQRLADRSPPPRYPANALRRGERGTVIVRVDVDANGMPGGVTLVQRSGSRDLDRAAMEAVRQWRFQPAMRDGTPVEGSLEIPFEFTP